MSFLNRRCRDVSRLLVERENRRLRPAEWLGVHLHLPICIACTRFERQLGLMRKALETWRK